MFTISSFGDEIADDLTEQLTVLNRLNIPGLELRKAWGINVTQMSDDEVLEVKRLCAEHNVHIPAFGSPIGKSLLQDPSEDELSRLDRLFQIGEQLGTRRIRIFSFYPPDRSSNELYDQYVDEAATRLSQLAERAKKNGFALLLENEKHIIGDTIERCHKLLTMVDNSSLQFAWDPANFVQVGEANVTERGWPILGERITYVHIKDAVLSDGSVRPAGEGDGQIEELLVNLRESGYNGYLALEPHLKIAGHSGGYSGEAGMTLAVEKLRDVMAKAGCLEETGT